MGAVKVDLSTKAKRLLDTYPIGEPIGVYTLLQNIHYVMESRYVRGDYDACNLLIDFLNSIEQANLTERQKQIIYLVFFKDMQQHRIAKLLNISQQAVSDHVNTAIKKIAFINRYEGDCQNVWFQR